MLFCMKTQVIQQGKSVSDRPVQNRFYRIPTNWKSWGRCSYPPSVDTQEKRGKGSQNVDTFFIPAFRLTNSLEPMIPGAFLICHFASTSVNVV